VQVMASKRRDRKSRPQTRQVRPRVWLRDHFDFHLGCRRARGQPIRASLSAGLSHIPFYAVVAMCDKLADCRGYLYCRRFGGPEHVPLVT